MEDQLRKLQLTQLEILKVIDSICRENEIDYSLYAGTLLGAVRHKGFIPWDDDLDICMTRENYTRFLNIWEKAAPKGYILQNKENSPGFSQSFTKIRKDHTAFWKSGEANDRYHIGIFVDIFPIDRVPNGKISRLVFQLNCLIYQLYTREFIPVDGSALEKTVSRIFLCTSSDKKRKKIREKLLRKITRYNSDKKLHMVAIETKGTIRTALPADLLDEYVDLPFEDGEFMCSKKWDELLTLKYHDYMQLPPKEQQQWTHKPLLIDFEHNFDELERI